MGGELAAVNSWRLRRSVWWAYLNKPYRPVADRALAGSGLRRSGRIIPNFRSLTKDTIVLNRPPTYDGIQDPVLRSLWKSLQTSERGQDLAEYCLLTALVALVALAIIWHAAGGIDGIWGSANSTLATGNSATSSSTNSGGSGTATAPDN